ncbi:unnamed protein product [Camellia sinensis]
MTVDHLHRFLIEVEGEDKATKEDAESIMESLNELKHLNIFHRKGLHLEAFFHCLFSDSNPPLSPSPKALYTRSDPRYQGRTFSSSGPILHVERSYHVDEPSVVLQQLQLESIVKLRIWADDIKSPCDPLDGERNLHHRVVLCWLMKKLVSGEAGKKKKKKKPRLPLNATEMQWKMSQDLAAENYMMPRPCCL